MLRQPNQDRRNSVWQAFVLLICLGLTCNFAYHAFYGRHGLLARNRLVERASLLEFETRSLEAVRAKLQRDVALLAPEMPDTDLVEEIARDMLGFVHPDDRIIVRGRN